LFITHYNTNVSNFFKHFRFVFTFLFSLLVAHTLSTCTLFINFQCYAASNSQNTHLSRQCMKVLIPHLLILYFQTILHSFILSFFSGYIAYTNK